MPFHHSHIMTGSYNNFFKVFNRKTKKDIMFEASKDCATPNTILKQRKVRFLMINLNQNQN